MFIGIYVWFQWLGAGDCDMVVGTRVFTLQGLGVGWNGVEKQETTFPMNGKSMGRDALLMKKGQRTMDGLLRLQRAQTHFCCDMQMVIIWP